jgi:hypothetical protein
MNILNQISGGLMFCAFTEFRPTLANVPIIAAKIGMIKTNLFLKKNNEYSVLCGY